MLMILISESEHPTAKLFVDLSKERQWAIASPVSIDANS